MPFEIDTENGRVALSYGPFEKDDVRYPANVLDLWSDDELAAIGVYRVAEDRWPADFAMSVQHRMEAVFLASVAEQRTAAREREALSGAKQQKSRVRDQRASTATDPTEYDLAAARRRTGAWSNRGFRR